MSLTCSGFVIKFIHNRRWECWTAFPQHPYNETCQQGGILCPLSHLLCERTSSSVASRLWESRCGHCVLFVLRLQHSQNARMPRMPTSSLFSQLHICLLSKGAFFLCIVALGSHARSRRRSDLTYWHFVFIAPGPIAFLNMRHNKVPEKKTQKNKQLTRVTDPYPRFRYPS